MNWQSHMGQKLKQYYLVTSKGQSRNSEIILTCFAGGGCLESMELGLYVHSNITSVYGPMSIIEAGLKSFARSNVDLS